MTKTAMDLVAEAKQKITEVSVETAKSKLSSRPILDVREPGEFAAGHLPGAINIPRGVLEFKISADPVLHNKQDEEIIVYCQTGGRSALAAEALHKIGYDKAVSMEGGFKAWTDNGYELG
ncbi:rhodanese-like domain-containing protein [Methylomarinum sp. Ch1-1]|uniref:Rhodanese-like domain-containing protein n=1 Tax=Methylomarinum roseum TaxID=3067653 RepID=A0AAU7NU88_9GAMM|nr:rhodanese-like domain-containing protein [Methylomarinum sp. Ch1-1]MDP4519329.1 rhodanese-like domain-containing protein [Methylomarinum sp. Ch1-1]